MDLDDTNTASGTGGSPWDDPVDLPEEGNKPKIVGTLDNENVSNEPEEKPVPFNIPKEIDEQVGKKIPASSVAANDQASVPANKPNTAPEVASKKATETAEMAKPETTPVGPLLEQPQPKIDPAGNQIVENASKPDVTENLPQEKSSPPVIDLSTPDGKQLEDAAMPPLPQQPVNTQKTTNNSLSDIKQPEINKPVSSDMPSINKPKKAGIFGFFKKRKPSSEKPVGEPVLPTLPVNPSQAKTNNTTAAVPPYAKMPSVSGAPVKPMQSGAKQVGAAPQFAKSSKPPLLKRPAFVITSCAILLIVAVTFLTEAGVMSLGLENIYGAIGLENLWGGLPKNPEKALAIAVANNQNHPNFKMSGTLSLTVNKTINSNITSPLVSAIALPYALSDSEISNSISGVLAQYESYYSGDSSTSTDSTASDIYGSSSYSSTPSVDSATDNSNSANNSATNSTTNLGDQSSYPSYQSQETTVKQLDFTFSGSSNKNAFSLDITVKKLVGSDSKISLLNSANDLYVKAGSDIKFNEKADPNKWLDYKLSALADSGNAMSQFYAAKPDQGFSIIGSRVANEKIGGVRCYNYQIDKLEIGGIFDKLGIKSEMVQKIDGNIWIGISDHLIHKADLIIIPSISSSVTRAEINIDFSGYDVENTITIPSLGDKIEIATSSSSSSSDTTPGSTYGSSSNAQASTAETNDNLRRSDLAKIKGGLEAYKQKYGKYPISSALLNINTAGNLVEKAIVPTYIDVIPADPKSSEGWFYGYVSDGKTFRLSARFENLNDKEITKSGDIYLHYVYNN
ncbi:MAG: hypothetical protein WC080_01840 [Patescibacteria group bacterium]